MSVDRSEAESTHLLLQNTRQSSARHKSFSSNDSSGGIHWNAFLIQMILWWSTWSLIDAVPGFLGINRASDSDFIIYAIDSVIGAFLFLANEEPLMGSMRLAKIRRFLGLVFLCCGAWGLLDSFARLLSHSVQIPSGLIYVTFLCFAALLGTMHHYWCKEDYLIDRLI